MVMPNLAPHVASAGRLSDSAAAARDAADALRGVPGAAAAIRRAGGVGEEPVPLCAAVAGAAFCGEVLSRIGRRGGGRVAPVLEDEVDRLLV